MTAARRLWWVGGLLALLFAPGQLSDTPDTTQGTGAVNAAALAPTLTSAELARAEPAAPVAELDRVRGPASLPVGPALALALIALLAVAPPARTERDPHTIRWRRRGPPLLSI